MRVCRMLIFAIGTIGLHAQPSITARATQRSTGAT